MPAASLSVGTTTETTAAPAPRPAPRPARAALARLSAANCAGRATISAVVAAASRIACARFPFTMLRSCF